MPKIEIDAIDRAILAALQDDGRLSNVDLAEKVGLSPSPCLRRVKRLEEAGVIRGWRAVIDRAAIGLGLTVFVELKARDHSRETAATLQARLAAMPAVVAAHMVSGTADFLAEVVVADLATYERLLTDELLNLPMVVDVRSNFALRRIKSDGALPIAAAEGAD